MSQNVVVQGSLTAYGKNLVRLVVFILQWECAFTRLLVQNLGSPFTALTDIPQGSIVSLSSSGGVLKGFGTQLSSTLATAAFLGNPIILNMTGTVVVMLYNDTNSYGQAMYWDSNTATPTVRLL